ncbi:AI-2E family transporter [Saprospiraceae bacterium]|nr:AI-2E family transporter [Saprospiraceae bacterium]
MNWKRTALVLIPLLLICVVVYYFTDVVAYVLISWVLSMIGQPIMKFLTGIRIKKFQLGRAVSAVLTLALFFVVFAVLSMLFVPMIIEQANNLSEVRYESIFSALQEPLQRIKDQFTNWGLVSEGPVAFADFKDTFANYFKPGAIGNFLGSLFGAASSLLIGLFSIVFITFFFLRESNLFNNFILALVPNEFEKDTLKVIEDISSMLRNYFSGILLQMTIITILVSSALALFGVENALLIGFFAAMINVIPYVGPLIGAIFAMFITISTNLDVDFYQVLMPLLTKVVVVFAGMQMADNFILQPFIYSKSVKAHPLEIFILILVAAKIGGVLGMILAIPTYTVIRVVAAAFLNQLKIVQKITQGMQET